MTVPLMPACPKKYNYSQPLDTTEILQTWQQFSAQATPILKNKPQN